MIKSRRDALALLGMTGAGSAAIATEVIAGGNASRTKGLSGPQINWIDHDRIVTALRNLADAVEAGHVECSGLDVSSALKGDDWLEQDLHIRFYLKERTA